MKDERPERLRRRVRHAHAAYIAEIRQLDPWDQFELGMLLIEEARTWQRALADMRAMAVEDMRAMGLTRPEISELTGLVPQSLYLLARRAEARAEARAQSTPPPPGA